jgi:predicted PurR-regulated permease PerM
MQWSGRCIGRCGFALDSAHWKMAQSKDSQGAQTIRRVLVIVALLAGGIALWQVRQVILLALTAVMLTILLTSPVRWLTRRGVGRRVAVVISLIGMVAVFILLVALMLPQLISQFGQLMELIPQALVALENWINELELPEGVEITPDTADAIVNQLVSSIGQIAPQIFPFFGSVTTVVLSVLIVGFMSMYFLLNPGMHERGLVALLPIRHRPRAWEIIYKLDRTLRGYLQAKVTSMLLVGFGTGLGLYLLGVPFAPALGAITGLFSFVPNFGPLAALIPTLAVTIINVPERVLWVIVLFYGIQLVESQFVGPLLVSQEINLAPVLVLVSQIVCSIFFDFLGLLLSVPLTAIAQVLVQEIYIKDFLGDRPELQPEVEEVPVVLPDVARPERPDVARPKRPDVARPERADIAQPERADIARPERADIARPEQADVVLSERLEESLAPRQAGQKT